jgi:hypothetical protein
MTFVLKIGRRSCAAVVREFAADDLLHLSPSVAKMLDLDEHSIGNARIIVCSIVFTPGFSLSS